MPPYAMEETLSQHMDPFEYAFVHSLIPQSITDPGGAIRVNDAFCNLLGYSREELLDASTWMQLTHPDDVALSQAHVDALLSGECEEADFEKRYLRKDGETVWAKVHTHLSRDEGGEALYFMTSIVDVSERMQAELTLVESEARFRSLFTSIDQGMALHEIVTDDAGTPIDYIYLDLNESYTRLLGVTRDAIGKRITEVMPQIERYWIENFGKVAQTGKPSYYENYLETTGRYYSTYAYSPKHNQFAVLVTDISERTIVESALRESEERYRTLTENTSDVVWALDPETMRFIYISPAVEKLRGFTPEEVMAQSLADAILPEYVEHTKEMLRANVAEYLASEGEQIVSETIELEQPCKDGSSIWTEVVASCRRNASTGRLEVHGITRDISERKRAQEALERSEQKFSMTFHLTPDAVNINRLSDGLYIDVNEGFTELTGYTHDDVAGKSSYDIDIWCDLADRERLVSGLRTDGAVNDLEAEFRRKDGSVTTGIMSARVMGIGGEPCILSVTRDISERKRIEDDIRRLNTELEERVQERTEELTVSNEELIESNLLLEEATRAKSDFLASMSHELRTPLNSIIGFTGILLQGLAGPINEEQRVQLRMVSDSGRHLLSLIDDILDLSKIEAGVTTAKLEPVDVPALTSSIMELMRPLATAKEIELASTFEPDDLVIDSDPRLLNQVLINLVGNAVKFTDEGSVSVIVKRDDEGIAFAVSDTGRGIRPAALPHVMERFYQAESLVEAKHGGTGLGLAISVSLAEILGGSLTCESEFGVGSTFTLRIPAAGLR